MASQSELKKGKAIMHSGEPYIIIEMQHLKVAMGKAHFKTKLKNIKNGKVLEYTFRAGEKVQEADVTYRPMQYTYHDDRFYFFMDDQYEERQLDTDVVGDSSQYLVEGMQVEGIFLDDQLISLQPPIKVVLTVKEAPPGVKGDSASGATKQITLETGMVVNAPLFINEGDKVRINTETGEYVERVQE